MGEDTTELQGGCAEHPGCDGRHGAAPQLLAERDVDEALALFDALEAGAPASQPLLFASLLQGSAEPAQRHAPDSDAAAALGDPGALLQGSARALLPELAAQQPGGCAALATGPQDGGVDDEVDAALGALEGVGEEPAWAHTLPAWPSQRPERLHAGRIGAQRAAAGAPGLGEGALDDALDPLDTWYVAPSGVPQGPLTLEVLRERWEAGAVGPDTPCWSGGMARWVPLARVLKLAGALAPPMPRLSLEQVASSLRAPPPPPPPAFQPVARSALQSLLAEEEQRERDEARSRAEALARMQEARAAALTHYVPPPPAAALEPAAAAGRLGSVGAALLGAAVTALVLTCAVLGFALLRSREGLPAQTAALAAAPAAAASAAPAAPPLAAQPAPPAAAPSPTAVAKPAKAPAPTAQPAPGAAAKSSSATAATSAASPKPAPAAGARSAAGSAKSAPVQASAGNAKSTPSGKAALAAAAAGDEAAAGSGEVAFDAEDAEDAAPAAEARPLGPDEEFERELSAEEPPLATASASAPGEGADAATADAKAADVKPADVRPAAGSGASAQPSAVPTTYVPPAPGGGAEVRESLAQADVLETVLAHRAQVKACVDAQRQVQPGLSGRLVVRFSVLPAGTTADVATETEELQGTPLARCIEGAVSGWSFPVHRVQGPQIRFPFTL